MNIKWALINLRVESCYTVNVDAEGTNTDKEVIILHIVVHD